MKNLWSTVTASHSSTRPDAALCGGAVLRTSRLCQYIDLLGPAHVCPQRIPLYFRFAQGCIPLVCSARLWYVLPGVCATVGSCHLPVFNVHLLLPVCQLKPDFKFSMVFWIQLFKTSEDIPGYFHHIQYQYQPLS